MKNLIRLFHVGVLCLALTFSSAFTGAAMGSTAMPQFNLKNAVDGTTVASSGFTGKVLLVIFFATWCPPCVEEIPSLIRLQKTYGENGFSVVALSVDQAGPEVVARLAERKGINYPVLMADEKTMHNFGGVYGIPVSFLVNREGNVVKKYTGYEPFPVLAKDIKGILD